MSIAEKINIYPLSNLKPLYGQEIIVKDKSRALFLLSNGEVKAIENKSPIHQTPIDEGIVSGEFVFCPIYDTKISLITGEIAGPEKESAQVFETEIIDGNIYITL